MPDLLPAVRGFVRDFNLAIKLVALYGVGHKQAAVPLETSWKELGAILGSEKKLLITAGGDRLLFDGRPLQAGSSDRSMAQLLGSAGIGGFSFLEALTLEEFTTCVSVIAGTKAPELCAELKRQLGPKSNLRVMELRLVGDDVQPGAVALGSVAGTGTATSNDILRLLSSVRSSGEGRVAPESATLEVGEHEATEAIRWLAHLGATGTTGQNGPELTDASAAALRETAASISGAELNSEQPALVALAEKLALRVTLDKYKRGEISFDAVHKMLGRFEREIEKLNELLAAQRAAMGQKVVGCESPTEVLERQFWAAMPTNNKLQVLQSEDAWSIPATNVQSFTEELLNKGDVASAEMILRHYCRFTGDSEALGRLLRGIGEMAELFVGVSPTLLHWIVELMGRQFSVELSPELHPVIKVAFGRLVKQAAATKNYAALASAMKDVRLLESVSPEFAKQVGGEIQFEGLAGEWLTVALEEGISSAELIYLLREIAPATASEIGIRFGRCRQRQKSERLRAIASELGGPVIECLRESLRTLGAELATPAVGLLTAIDADSVEVELRKRLPSWTIEEHAAVVHQIACSSAASRGVLLTHLLETLHPLIVPQALDEIGNSGSAEMNKLTELVRGRGIAANAPFVQLKAVEALGMLRETSTGPLLTSILTTKARWSWQYPRELRVVALQSLYKIDQRATRQLMADCGLTEEDLKMSPLPPKTESWVRSRRYDRIPVANVWAVIQHAGGSCTLSLENLSLGGGAGTTTSRGKLAAEGDVEITFGLRKLKASVLLYSHSSYKIAFEIAAMSLEDRAKLRQLLVSKAS